MENKKQEWYKLQSLRSFEVKYLGATANNGSRVVIKDLRNNKRKVVPFNYEYDNIGEIALSYLNSIGFEFVAKNCLPNKDIILTTDFEGELK